MTSLLFRPGDKGIDVAALQHALNLAIEALIKTHKADDIIKADGIYGEKTARAVRMIQRKQFLNVDAVAGPITLNQLFNLVIVKPRTHFAVIGEGDRPVSPSPVQQDSRVGNADRAGVSLGTAGIALANPLFPPDADEDPLFPPDPDDYILRPRPTVPVPGPLRPPSHSIISEELRRNWSSPAVVLQRRQLRVTSEDAESWTIRDRGSGMAISTTVMRPQGPSDAPPTPGRSIAFDSEYAVSVLSPKWGIHKNFQHATHFVLLDPNGESKKFELRSEILFFPVPLFKVPVDLGKHTRLSLFGKGGMKNAIILTNLNNGSTPYFKNTLFAGAKIGIRIEGRHVYFIIESNLGIKICGKADKNGTSFACTPDAFFVSGFWSGSATVGVRF